jgi:hypothetical protein
MFCYHLENKSLLHCLAGALVKLKINAKSWLNWQIPILTEGEHTNARIINMHIEKINEYLNKEELQSFLAFKVYQKMEILPQLEEEAQMQQQ